MNTIWLKIAGVAVAVVVAIVVVGRFRSGDSSQPPAAEPQSQSAQEDKPKTFYDMAEQDKRYNEPPAAVETPPVEPAQEPPVQQPEPAEQPPAPVMAQADTRPPGVVYPSDIEEPSTLYFKPMSEMEDIEAQRLLPYATAGRSIGRLPVMQYGLMMRAIEQIEQRWPDSWYAFRAKQMMEEITWHSDRYAMMYKITPQRLDISRFMKPRQGTEPRMVEPIRR